MIVTDNGSCYRTALLERFIASRAYLVHVRTRYRSPQANGVIERSFESIKYEHLYREEIQSGAHLADEVEAYRTLHNTVRLHVALAFRTPIEAYLKPPEL